LILIRKAGKQEFIKMLTVNFSGLARFLINEIMVVV